MSNFIKFMFGLVIFILLITFWFQWQFLESLVIDQQTIELAGKQYRCRVISVKQFVPLENPIKIKGFNSIEKRS